MLSTFFYQDGRSENQLPRARAVMVDMEPKVGNCFVILLKYYYSLILIYRKKGNVFFKMTIKALDFTENSQFKKQNLV